MLALTQCTPIFGDCTAGYRVDPDEVILEEGCTVEYRVWLDKEYTLQEFVDAILTNKKDERGKISIVKRNSPWHRYPYSGYQCGNITNKSNIPEKVFDYKVKSVTASSGWTATDYIVTLEKEVE